MERTINQLTQQTEESPTGPTSMKDLSKVDIEEDALLPDTKSLDTQNDEALAHEESAISDAEVFSR